MVRRSWLVPALGSLALAAGCVVEPVDFAGKSCPCSGEDWVCVDDRCVQRDALPDGGEPDTGMDAGQRDAAGTDAKVDASDDPDSGPGDDAGEDCTPAIVVSDLEPLWWTPNAIRWGWSSVGEEPDFGAYELQLATSREALDSGEGVMTWTSEQNPELGNFVLRDTGRSDDFVVATTTDDLDPDTDYFARLVAIDSRSCRSESNVARRRTDPSALRQKTLFEDTDMAGWTLPSCYAPVTDASRAQSGERFYEWNAQCEENPDSDDPSHLSSCTDSVEGSECWGNLRQSGLTIPVDELSASGPFNEAYLELWVAIDDAPRHAYFSLLWLTIQPTPSCSDNIWRMVPITLRADGRYRRYQVKLGALSCDGVPLTAEEFSDGVEVTQVNVGSKWVDGSSIRVDEVFLYW